MYYYEVALPYPLRQALIYQSERRLPSGAFVFVPLRSQAVPGVVLKQSALPKKQIKLKNILLPNERPPDLDFRRLKWLKWMAQYYHYPESKVIHLSFPFASACSLKQFMKKNNKKLSDKKTTSRPCLVQPGSAAVYPSLSAEQSRCIKDIQSQGDKNFCVHLIHGVTGSGKTEIFFRLIEPALAQKKSALILVPEIALTPQHIKRFSQRFPGQVASLHSGLTVKEKKQQWRDLLTRQKRILIGPRSALFCPLPDLAWIIVDEEHESHFKQEDNLKYQGRDCAVYLGKCLNIPVVLASATPSMESWQNAQSGKYFYHSLKQPVLGKVLSKLEVVDMKKQLKEPGRPWWMSAVLLQALKTSFQKKEQSALFLNRRGEQSFLFCPSCGFQFFCSNCDISLTQHKKNYLLCHYCGFQEEKPEQCTQCGGEQLKSFGLGTQTLEKELKKLFPQARIARADRDEIQNHIEWADLISRMENKEVDILIGTQMIAKGLDFSDLNLVGVILADQGLNRPDFRSAEKHFQLLTQMAGRAGRRAKPGRVILQTFNPNHFLIQSLQKGSYRDFSLQELKHRKKHRYPPFGRLILIRVQSLKESSAFQQARRIRDNLEKKFPGLELLGPAPAPLFRIRNKYRYHLLLKSTPEQAKKLDLAGPWLLQSKNQSAGVQVYINKDPVSMQ